jgi:hypothetical protein
MAFVSPPIIATGDLVPASEWNANWSYLYDSGWIAFSAVAGGYTNSWASSHGPAAGATVAGYRKIGNVVRFGGSIGGGSSGNAAFTMPAGTRPTYDLQLTIGPATINAIDVWIVKIPATGVVTPQLSAYGGAGISPTLDGVTYTID